MPAARGRLSPLAAAVPGSERALLEPAEVQTRAAGGPRIGDQDVGSLSECWRMLEQSLTTFDHTRPAVAASPHMSTA